MTFIRNIKTKYKIVTARKQTKLHKDFAAFIELEREEFLLDDKHLSLEQRKKLVALRKKELEKKKAEIIKDIENDTSLTKAQKHSDIARLENHLDHYERGLDSMVNALKWRDGKDIPTDEWAKKALAPKGDKLAKSKAGGIPSFAIPPGLTCPKAGTCKNHCFALSGHTAYVQMVRDTHSAALGLSERDDFIEKMNEQIRKKWPKEKYKQPNPKSPYRIHAWGDFYSNAYAKKWVEIIKSNPNVWFYAYTKSFTMPVLTKLLKDIKKGTVTNAKIIQSVNGKTDKQIDPTQPVAVVFKSRSDMDAWNKGITSIKTIKYEKNQAKRLKELADNIVKLSKEEQTKAKKHEIALLTKEMRKLKREASTEREEAYTNLVNLLTKLKITPNGGKFKECKETDLVAADPAVKRIGIVEHGELHQPRGYKIQEIEQTITAKNANFGDRQTIHCEQLQGISHDHSEDEDVFFRIL